MIKAICKSADLTGSAVIRGAGSGRPRIVRAAENMKNIGQPLSCSQENHPGTTRNIVEKLNIHRSSVPFQLKSPKNL